MWSRDFRIREVPRAPTLIHRRLYGGHAGACVNMIKARGLCDRGMADEFEFVNDRCFPVPGGIVADRAGDSGFLKVTVPSADRGRRAWRRIAPRNRKGPRSPVAIGALFDFDWLTGHPADCPSRLISQIPIQPELLRFLRPGLRWPELRREEPAAGAFRRWIRRLHR